jgi:hypothetical protein
MAVLGVLTGLSAYYLIKNDHNKKGNNSPVMEYCMVKEQEEYNKLNG